MARGKYPLYRSQFSRVTRRVTQGGDGDGNGDDSPSAPSSSSARETLEERGNNPPGPLSTGGMTASDFLGALGQRAAAGYRSYETAGRVPHGVPGEIDESTGRFVGPQGFGRRGGPQTVSDNEFIYFQGDEMEPVSWSESRVIELQQTLAEIGLLPTYSPGNWDNSSAEAYARVMGYANQRGYTVGMALDQFPDEVQDAQDVETPPLITQLTPTADLRNVFRDASTSLTGQGFDQNQIEAAIGAYHDLERSMFEEEHAARYDVEGQTGSERGYGPGGEVEGVPDPQNFLRQRIMEEDPSAIQEHSILGAGQEALQFLSNPQWGQGLGGSRL